MKTSSFWDSLGAEISSVNAWGTQFKPEVGAFGVAGGLGNFDLKLSSLEAFDLDGDGDKLVQLDLLVLDPYGDGLSAKMKSRLFGHNKKAPFTIAIDKTNGDIYHVILETGMKVEVFLDKQNGVHFPANMLPRLDELRGKKRPYSMQILAERWESFIQRHVGYDELLRAVVYTFNFGSFELEINEDCYRTLSQWTTSIRHSPISNPASLDTEVLESIHHSYVRRPE